MACCEKTQDIPYIYINLVSPKVNHVTLARHIYLCISARLDICPGAVKGFLGPHLRGSMEACANYCSLTSHISTDYAILGNSILKGAMQSTHTIPFIGTLLL